jgi:transposase-like protein
MGVITTELVDTGEKRDTRGRRVTPAERRLQMVAAYRASGVTMAAFARRERINYATFAGWVAKATSPNSAKAPIKFAEVALPNTARAAALDPLEVRLADGTVLRGSRVSDLVALVRALRA